MGRTVAIVPAAGSGERLATGVPKASVDLAGQTLIERALAGLRSSEVTTPLDLMPAEAVLGGQ